MSVRRASDQRFVEKWLAAPRPAGPAAMLESCDDAWRPGQTHKQIGRRLFCGTVHIPIPSDILCDPNTAQRVRASVVLRRLVLLDRESATQNGHCPSYRSHGASTVKAESLLSPKHYEDGD